MYLELIPVVAGVLVGAIGLGLLVDAWAADDIALKERRRSPRIERSRTGEAMIGLGVLCMAAAFIGRDTWPYSVVSVIVGVVLMVPGTIANRKFLRDAVQNRGALRRRDRY
jgi:xanthine/uracil permease